MATTTDNHEMTQLELDLGCAQLDPKALFHGRYSELLPVIKMRLFDYLKDGTYPGAFLQGVITNDLRLTVNSARATEYEAWYAQLPLLVWWVYNQAPACYVGYENYFKHVKQR